MKKKRTWFAADKTGFHMLHALFQTTLKYNEVTRYDEVFVTRLLVDDGRVHGVVAVGLMTGKIQAVTAKSVILATGGCGKVFPFTTNANINTGDGMSLAYRAGAPLKDMEFVQYHPTGLPFTGILITEATRAEGGWLLNKDGYRYLQDYDLGQADTDARSSGAWSSARATGCRRRSCTRWRRAGRRTRRTARSSTSTCGTSARSSSTPSSRSCASCA